MKTLLTLFVLLFSSSVVAGDILKKCKEFTPSCSLDPLLYLGLCDNINADDELYDDCLISKSKEKDRKKQCIEEVKIASLSEEYQEICKPKSRTFFDRLKNEFLSYISSFKSHKYSHGLAISLAIGLGIVLSQILNTFFRKLRKKINRKDK